MLPPLLIYGAPGKLGGACTKIAHLLRLLRNSFQISMILPHVGLLKNREIRQITDSLCIPCKLLKDIPRQPGAVLLAICDAEFFSRHIPDEAKKKGLRVVWSNEMMFPFRGEAEAAQEGLVDRVLYVSELQAALFEPMYKGTSARITGNYIDPDDYRFASRRNIEFTIGRLSRADVDKYPANFPVFFEAIGLSDVKFRVMAWSSELQKKYRWHRFGPKWELLPANREPALRFLYSLDLFVYPLGHRIRESWGRAVVEAMLTGCVPIVPSGHQFDKLMVHGKSGFICNTFSEFRDVVHALYKDFSYRENVARCASSFARERLCDPADHLARWEEALSF